MDIILSVRKQEMRMSSKNDKDPRGLSRSGLVPTHLPTLRDDPDRPDPMRHDHRRLRPSPRGTSPSDDLQLPRIVGMNPNICRDGLETDVDSVQSSPRKHKNVILRLRNRSRAIHYDERRTDLSTDPGGSSPPPCQAHIFKRRKKKRRRKGSSLVQVVGMSMPTLPRRDEGEETPLLKFPKPSHHMSDSSPAATSDEIPVWWTSRRHAKRNRRPSNLMLRGSKCIDTPPGDGGRQPKPTARASKPRDSPSVFHQGRGQLSPAELTDAELEEFDEFQRWSQRERLAAELELMERMRGLHRKYDSLSHRAPIDLLLGGEKVMLFERMDILGELARLKSIALPAKAKELYVGRGFKLPSSHTLNKPPRPRNHSSSSTEATSKSAVHSTTDNYKGSPLPYLLRGRTNSRIPPFSPVKRSHQSPLSPGSRGLGSEVTPHPPSLPRSPQKLHPSPVLGRKKQPTPRRQATGAIPRTANWLEQQQHNVPPNYDSVRAEVSGDTEHGSDAEPVTTPGLRPSSDLLPGTSIEDGRVTSASESEAMPRVLSPVNPFMITEMVTTVHNKELEQMRGKFKQLDAQTPGQVDFPQLDNELPPNLTISERRFIQRLFDAISSSLAMDERAFVFLWKVSQTVSRSRGVVKESYEKIDFHLLPMTITRYLGLYQSIDKINSGRITLEELRTILATTISPALRSGDGSFSRICLNVTKETETELSKTDYVAYIPYFMSLEPGR